MDEQKLIDFIKKEFYAEQEESTIELTKLSVPYLIKQNQLILDREISNPKLFFDLFDEKAFSTELYYFDDDKAIHLFFVTCADNPISFTTSLIEVD